jgi:hypothetical protein
MLKKIVKRLRQNWYQDLAKQEAGASRPGTAVEVQVGIEHLHRGLHLDVDLLRFQMEVSALDHRQSYSFIQLRGYLTKPG